MFLNTLRLALRATLANKMRSFLTMLGIIIGVMSVVMLVSIAQSATTSISTAISSMGSDILTVSVTNEDVSVSMDQLMKLEEFDSISAVAPYITLNTAARHESSYQMVSAYGVTEKYMDVQNMTVQAGRGIIPSDIEWKTSVCVIGTEVAGNLFGTYDVIGKTVTMSNKKLTIVGLLSESGSNGVSSLDSRVLIPITTAMRMSDTTSISSAYVQVSSLEEMDYAKVLAEYYLYTLTGDEDAYSVYNMTD